MAKYAVATVDEIPPAGRKIVEVAGRSIGIFNVDGKFFALRNSCPHEGGPLCRGILCGEVTSDTPGEYRYGRAGQILRCPWHGWEFDIRTGQSWFDPRKVRVRSYEVTIESAPTIVTSDVGEPPEPGMEPGPFIAETYEVTVERRQVVVEVPN